MKYKIYTGPNCPSCKILKERLKNRTDIEWASVDDPTTLADAMFDDVQTLPTLIINGKKYDKMKEILFTVGYDDRLLL